MKRDHNGGTTGTDNLGSLSVIDLRHAQMRMQCGDLVMTAALAASSLPQGETGTKIDGHAEDVTQYPGRTFGLDPRVPASKAPYHLSRNI